MNLEKITIKDGIYMHLVLGEMNRNNIQKWSNVDLKSPGSDGKIKVISCCDGKEQKPESGGCTPLPGSAIDFFDDHDRVLHCLCLMFSPVKQ